MHRDTVASLIEAAGTVGTTVAKEMLSRRQETKMMDRQAQYKKELAAARAGETVTAEGSAGPSTPSDALSEAEKTAVEYEQMMQTAADMESCDLCTRLIQAAQQEPAARQAKLLPQLREFLDSVEDGESTQSVAQRVREQDALLDLMHQTLSE